MPNCEASIDMDRYGIETDPKITHEPKNQTNWIFFFLANGLSWILVLDMNCSSRQGDVPILIYYIPHLCFAMEYATSQIKKTNNQANRSHMQNKELTY